ncbi:MAG: hypothetical protein HKN33_03240 [Pyrinomonadaceae bacterium]|nr:hypothetical protein [Pyrinomonadaceae bacterium]
MKKVCFLSTDNLEGYEIDDDLAIGPLHDRGWHVETVPWKEKIDWAEFDAVVIRTPWDYHHTPGQFIATLETIAGSGVTLENSIELVKWNIEKTYLRSLEARGVRTVPTIYPQSVVEPKAIRQWKDRLQTEELVLKPTISATAGNTFLVSEFTDELKVLNGSRFMVQPFMESIGTEGEFSLFFFDGEFSHAILKTPKKGDFRVQEDFGGQNKSIEPDDEMLGFGCGVLKELPETPLYARVDFVHDNKNKPVLMELELIEPALYFRYDEEAAESFARKFCERNEL